MHESIRLVLWIHSTVIFQDVLGVKSFQHCKINTRNHYTGATSVTYDVLTRSFALQHSVKEFCSFFSRILQNLWSGINLSILVMKCRKYILFNSGNNRWLWWRKRILQRSKVRRFSHCSWRISLVENARNSYQWARRNCNEIYIFVTKIRWYRIPKKWGLHFLEKGVLCDHARNAAVSWDEEEVKAYRSRASLYTYMMKSKWTSYW